MSTIHSICSSCGRCLIDMNNVVIGVVIFYVFISAWSLRFYLEGILKAKKLKEM